MTDEAIMTENVLEEFINCDKHSSDFPKLLERSICSDVSSDTKWDKITSIEQDLFDEQEKQWGKKSIDEILSSEYLNNLHNYVALLALYHPDADYVKNLFEKTNPLTLFDRNKVLDLVINYLMETKDKSLCSHALENLSTVSATSDLLPFYKVCMKYLPLDEAIAKHPDIEQDLRIAYNGRNASAVEFKYALRLFDNKTLAETNIFREQQHVMNVLFTESYMESIASTVDHMVLVESDPESFVAGYIMQYMGNKELAEQIKEQSKKSEKISKEEIEKRINARIAQAQEEVKNFRRPDATNSVKDYLDSQSDYFAQISFRCAAIFKYFPAYIKTIKNHNGKYPEDKLSMHDAFYWMPEPRTSEQNERLGKFLKDNIIYQNAEHKDRYRPISELKVIAQNWSIVEKKLQSNKADDGIKKLKYKDVLSLCKSVKYIDQRDSAFAVEASKPKNSVGPEDYHKYEDIYLAGLKVPEPFDSKKTFKEGKYTGRFLPRNDVRTGFFGNYTDCCQHFGGVGNSCAISTVKDPFSQLFVIENDKGDIIAGSWTWENTEGKYREVCFDNIEIKGNFSKDAIDDLKKSVKIFTSKMNNCVKAVEATKLADLWKDYSQTLKKCQSGKKDSEPAKEEIEHLKEVSHLIDNELQSKEIREHVIDSEAKLKEISEDESDDKSQSEEIRNLMYIQALPEMWAKLKATQKLYETTKEVFQSIKSIYSQTGEYLAKEQNCYRVTIGLGYQDADVSEYKRTERITLPKLYGDEYSDATRQVLLTENPDAKQLDKTQESQRYIRNVCFFDRKEMKKISNAVFSESDQNLQVLENMSGFVIEDREKGVVGYCLYDAEEKEIYDMVVLPEYRNDKNASSRKLFAEMMKVINQEGGEWSAKLRDNTTVRYMEIMKARGIIKIEEYENVMSDGTVSITFSPIPEKLRQMKYKLENNKDEEQTATENKQKSVGDEKNTSNIVLNPSVRENV